MCIRDSLPARAGRHGEGQTRRARAPFHRNGRPRWLREPLSRRTLRRHAPARVACPYTGVGAENPVDGRAIRRARRADAAAARRQGAADPAAAETDHAADHPQHHRSGADVRPHFGDDLPARQDEAHRRYRSAAPAYLGGRHQRGVRPLRRANLERPARRGEPRHARRGSSRAASRRSIVVTAAAPARRARPGNFAAATVGLGALAAFLLAVEILIQIGVVNRFIVPPPSEIIGSFGRVIVEENVFGRFLLTLTECLTAGVMVFGVAGGVLMHRFKLLQQACETWVAAMASAPIVLMYPLFLVIFGRNAWTIIMMGFFAALPPVILKTIEGLSLIHI